MNYPLELEKKMFGKWSCYELREEQNRLSTLYEKLDDCFRTLSDFWEALKVYDDPFPRAKEIVNQFTKKELSVAICILKFQCQAYRKVLLDNEHKLIWSFCNFCNEKRWWYRLPNASRYPSKHNGVVYEFPVRLDGHLNTMFHCMKCHLVSYESDIGKVEYEKSDGYISTKPALKSFLMEMAELSRPLHIQQYYKQNNPELENVQIEKFFIVKDEKYFCVGCGCYYKKKFDAERHRKKFWGHYNDDYNLGCRNGIYRMIKQKGNGNY